MFRRLYNLLFPVAFLLILPGYLRRMVRRGSYRRNFAQRFGYYASDVRQRLADMQGAIWVEAVSVGEMLVALKLVAALRQQAPDLPLILSTTTTTGYALAEDQAPKDTEVIYTPIDLQGAVVRAFEALRPKQLIIVDGGLWPNQLWEARRRGVSTALVNARLSPRSERRFRRFPRLAGEIFGSLDLVCVSEESDLVVWQSLGVKAAHLQHTGSVKFDDAPPGNLGQETVGAAATDGRGKQGILTSLGVLAGTPILLAGSTHPGEERAVAEVFLRLRSRFPDLFMIVAPRHMERCGEVQSALQNLGLQVALRTVIPAAPPPFPPDVLLVNTTGELRDWYRTATLVFVGKSLRSVGGQNPAEAIAAGVPVIFGPHMENFADLVASLLTANAAVQISNSSELETQCAKLLHDPTERTRLVEAARKQILAHRGAAARTASAVLQQNQNSACQSR